MRKSHLAIAVVALLSMVLFTGCAPAAKQGTLQFYANGEGFVRQGFVSKDGWAITFDHVYITLTDVAAYQTSPPYDPHSGGDIKSQEKVALAGTHTVDLAEGGEDAPPILVGDEKDATVGHYNAISWKMAKALDDELNVGAPGFEPFAGVTDGGNLDADMAALQARMSADDYQVLVDTLLTLGHVGEGHCRCDTH